MTICFYAYVLQVLGYQVEVCLEEFYLEDFYLGVVILVYSQVDCLRRLLCTSYLGIKSHCLLSGAVGKLSKGGRLYKHIVNSNLNTF